MKIWLLTLLSVLIVSLISLIGIIFLAIKKDLLKRLQLVLVALATGGLLGGAFFHLLPEAFESFNNSMLASLMLTLGFLLFFILERFLHWHHNHTSGISENAIKPFGTVNLVADMFHNFLDGLLIAAAFTYSTEIGLATTLAVFFHELPQEIGDFGVLIHAGFSRKKALIFNFLSACTAFLGAIMVLVLGNNVANIEKYILSFSAGGFIYLAAADLIPELHNEKTPSRSLVQFIALLTGLGLLFGLSLILE
ncbi:MAG: ZIP family metal transporter [Bacteroidales bacterium]|nr:ZIP family metal transporter [Bacteroidales bacterium]